MKSSGTTASSAVPTSMAITPVSGSTLSSSAPRGGEMMFMTPASVWLTPATRARCFSGTISEVDACMAGHWNAPTLERKNMMVYTCQTCIRPAANKQISPRVARAIKLSAAIMMARRFQRSTNVPAKGPMNTCGRIATREAVASTVAEPVVCVNHQTKANWTNMEPSRESAWPPQMVKNRGAQRAGRDSNDALVIRSVPPACRALRAQEAVHAGHHTHGVYHAD